ncbi:recombinase family protein [Streptomyces sp. NPDC048484]|uniref:recombinase family protein n=1 Tax=Streptomyces sp. NPDC048484 TaxID=3155146 RepID=UPI00341C5BCE
MLPTSSVTPARSARRSPARRAARVPAPWAGTYHTGRFTKVPRLAKLLRVPTPADRGPGQPWRPGTPVPLALAPDTPTADIRIGYARCSTLTQELQSQLDALAKHGIPRDRDKVFSEKISTRARVRPQFEAALALARQIKAHAPHCRVVFTVYEMKRLGRDAAELTALADHLTVPGTSRQPVPACHRARSRHRVARRGRGLDDHRPGGHQVHRTAVLARPKACRRSHRDRAANGEGRVSGGDGSGGDEGGVRRDGRRGRVCGRIR